MPGWLRTTNCACAGCGPSNCAPPFCCTNLDTSGGDAGYYAVYNVTGQFSSTTNINVFFETYTIKDRLVIAADGVNLYDSGCISGNVSPVVGIPGGTLNVSINVLANCEGTNGTAWVLQISCP